MASLTLVVAACGVSVTGPALSTSTVTPVASAHVGTTEGCAADEWRQPQFFDSWEEYQPGDLVGSVFPSAGPYFDMTLAQALEPSAAIGPDRGAALVREAVAAPLNAAHEDLEYPYRRYEEGIDGRPPIVPTVDRLLASGPPMRSWSSPRIWLRRTALAARLTDGARRTSGQV
jgi:hypothetical protein